MKNTDPIRSELSEEAGKLTKSDLELAYQRLKMYSVPTNEPIPIHLFFTTWEFVVYWFSPRYAFKLWADRQIRQFGDKHTSL